MLDNVQTPGEDGAANKPAQQQRSAAESSNGHGSRNGTKKVSPQTVFMTLLISSVVTKANVREVDALTDPAIAELVASLKARGMETPIKVYYDPATGKYVVIDGHRRMLAAKLAGINEVPAVVVDKPKSSKERVLSQLALNENRIGLSVLDQAKAFKALHDAGMTVTAIAEHIGCSKGKVGEYMKLFRLPEEIRVKVLSGELSAKSVLRGFNDDGTAKEKKPKAAGKAKHSPKSKGLAEGQPKASAGGPAAPIWTDPSSNIGFILTTASQPDNAALIAALRNWLATLEAQQERSAAVPTV